MEGETFEVALERETLRLNTRFLEEVVEQWNICPWARPARGSGEVERVVWQAPLTLDGAPNPDLVARIHAMEQRADVVVWLLICPREDLGADAWSERVDAIRRDILHAEGHPRTFAAAPFHPDLDYRPDRPAAMVPLFRRSPDPTIQLVRLAVLRGLAEKGDGQERYATPEEAQRMIRGEVPARKSVSERVADANFETAANIGVQTLLAHLAEIAEDRQRTHTALAARFGVSLPAMSAP